ncbi:MAG: CDP-alcohol phosphatidyltransferase family protein, partial [Spirochaetaceae bacterium]|nr:CDP-alcohol phosphatidyltransferase family protein [Spirochaetaceae bacterium]
MNIPNIISISRVGILFIFLPLIYYGSTEMKMIAIVLCPVMFLMDYFDGYFARKLNMTTQIGSFFDLMGDRITEIVLWLFFFSLGMVPWWAPTIIIFRGFLSDWTGFRAKKSGKTVYAMMESPICKFLVCSKIMRGFYGSMKMILFI